MERSSKYFSAMEVCTSILESFLGLGRALYELQKFVSDPEEITEAARAVSKGERINRRKSQLLMMMKIPFAVRGLTWLLGYPPDMKRIAEAIGEPYKKVWRILHKKESLLMLNLSEKSAEQVGRQKVGLSKGVTTFQPKLVGKKYLGSKVPGPSRMYAFIKSASSFKDIPMLPSERQKLSEYLSEAFFLDLRRDCILKYLHLSFSLFRSNKESSLKMVHSVLSPVGKRVLEIAKREKVAVSEELEKWLSFDWVPLLVKIDDTIINELESRLNDAFTDDVAYAQASHMAPEHSYLIEESGRIFLVCSMCGSKTQQDENLENLKCKVCGARYLEPSS